jgi:hypothetical protein
VSDNIYSLEDSEINIQHRLLLFRNWMFYIKVKTTYNEAKSALVSQLILTVSGGVA